MARLSFRCDDGLLAAVDRARGDVAREKWLRKVVERAVSVELPDLARGDVVDSAGRLKRADVVFDRRSGEVLTPKPVSEPERPEPHRGCHEHPDAGRVQSRGRWWCGEPGCTRSVL